MGSRIDLTGQIFGRLTVISEAGKAKNGTFKWLCKCSCLKQTELVVRADNLRRGVTKSCSCLNKEILSQVKTTHGLSEHPLYWVFASMKERCYNQNSPHYKNYGERGIKICTHWLESFENFYKDVSMGYEKGLELDRIDNDGDYEPENIRWVTSQQNLMNKRGHRNSSSCYKGVSWNKSTNKWGVKIQKEGKNTHIGYFVSEIEAAKAYNRVAEELFGEYANLNILETPHPTSFIADDDRK